MVADDSPSKAICSICYEDLNPIVEDLQSISICGHVFHELCLQQWFEYSAKSKKLTCPVCKQRCAVHNAIRLYFQSTGDPVITQSRSVLDGLEESPGVLRKEVKKLESKVSVLKSTLDHHQEELKRINEELHLCKEQLSKEVTLKVEALKQKEQIQSALQTKSSELVQSSLRCSKLEGDNLALAKELAALKLLADLNLGEEDILKLASLGNEFSSQDTVDVLKKTLFIRNKSYKELMAKCSSLGRGEARSLRKLEKTKEKIAKLKSRIQELETTIEEKDNEVLRAAKASKKKRDESARTLNLEKSSSTSPIRIPSHEQPENQQFTTSVINLDEDEHLIAEIFGAKKALESPTNVKGEQKAIGKVEVVDCEILTSEDMLKEPKSVHKIPSEMQTTGSDECKVIGVSDLNVKPNFSTSSPGPDNCITHDSSATETDVGLSLKNIKQASSLLHNDKKEAPCPILISQPGDRCFVGGLLGPDGNNRYLGKWCKRAQTTSGSAQGSKAPSLIAVGADGRGGRVKVLRHPNRPNQSSADGKENSGMAKRCKVASNSSSSLQSRGFLQMEHFFGRVNRQD